MKIFDCTTFYNEKLLMEIRFNILNKHVHKFVVVESKYSHSGNKKKLNFNINDFPDFKNKIEYIVINDEPNDLIKDEEKLKLQYYKRLNSIKRVEQSYNYMMLGVESANNNDLILLSDNDEIPNLNSIIFRESKTDYFIFKQLFFYYKFNLLYDRVKWFGTKGCKKSKLKNFSQIRNLKNKKYPFWRLDTLISDTKQIDLTIVKDGGWHFTNLKTAPDLFEKFMNFGHHDEFEEIKMSVADLENKIKNKEVFYNHLLDKSDKKKWHDSYKLKKINQVLLPNFLIKNYNKYQEWFD